MQINNRLTVIVLSLLLINCTTFFLQRHTSAVNRKCCNQIESNFNTFQIKNTHPLRSIDIITNKINKTSLHLITLFNKYRSDSSDSLHLKITINPCGEFFAKVIAGDIETDSMFTSDLQSIFQKIKLDSINGYKAIAMVHLLIRSSGVITVSDSVTYYPGRCYNSMICTIDKKVHLLTNIQHRYEKQNFSTKGQVRIKLSINEMGDVVFAKIVSSTTGHDIFDKEILARVSIWKFCTSHYPGETTDLMYTFQFK
jgi:TonB family protein